LPTAPVNSDSQTVASNIQDVMRLMR
jgi:hypothetical protein